MKTNEASRPIALIATAIAVSLASPAKAQAPDPTDIDDIVMYAIESSSPGLLMRYFFRSDTFVEVGEVWTTTGQAVDDVEALSYIASGPYRGLYGIATKGLTEQHLTRINPLTAEATLYGPNLGGQDVTGMISDYDEVSGQWTLLASDKGKKLRRINPADGNAETICNVGVVLEGLARNSAGIIYGNTTTKLYRIDPSSGNQYNAVLIGSTGLSKAESLEFAFGNNTPQVEIPGVDESWMEFGVLFAFDDNTDSFGIVNPNTGQFKQYLVNGVPSSFSNQDAEGMIFVTTLNDPLYGSIDGFD